jgi:hypothetical protein
VTEAASLLAMNGYPALALAYFAAPGLPATLAGVPLEYFARAVRLLRAQPGVDSGMYWCRARRGAARPPCSSGRPIRAW